jgi:hypothetical protein
MADIKWSAFPSAVSPGAGDTLVVLHSGANTRFTGLTIPFSATVGGTGLVSPTAHGVMIGEGASAMTPIVLGAGQILIGTTSSDPAAAAINSGTNIVVANGSGSITVNASGNAGLTTSNIAGTTQAAAVNKRYIVANASQTTITLPTTFAIGDIVIIKGLGAAGWILQAGVATTIQLLSQSTTSGGTLTSSGQYDTVQISGLVANTTWSVDYVLSVGLTPA